METVFLIIWILFSEIGFTSGFEIRDYDGHQSIPGQLQNIGYPIPKIYSN